MGQEVISKEKEKIVSGKVTFPQGEEGGVLLGGVLHLALGDGEGPCYYYLMGADQKISDWLT